MTFTRQSDEKIHCSSKYIPPAVKVEYAFLKLNKAAIAEIENELKNPTSPRITNYIKTRLEGNKYGRYSKKLFGNTHGIIYGQHGLYAIYNEGEKQAEIAPSGTYGKIKLVKNLLTDEWLILKTQLLENPNNLKSKYLSTVFENEHEILKTLGLSNEVLMSRRSTKDKKILKGFLLMEYAKGEDLFSMLHHKVNTIQPSSRWPDLFWLHLCIRITEAVCELNTKSVLHCDIKFENFIYDIINDTIHVIDFGNAQKNLNGYVTPLHRSLEGFNAPENFNSTYTEKSEVFALSNILEGFLLNRVVGSSRVDLQACKLEYSIVSPK